ncbi:uncharacterized protein LOC132552010 isoform X2 [Ylistrum balloti]|uniref:uncharacterized protein LOC132552010 isoform X2 n=1 Tax=Ylistrum balloti TaxID=509963 RepID=UPI0029059256|nr:uncharacterized protein LOC132552010 isoform X2 [Ylistrum balloti]
MKSLTPIIGLTRPRWNVHTAAATLILTRSISTHYDTLGVKKNASNEEIKNAFVELSKKYHPDVSTHKDTSQKFAEVAEAYAVLGNEKSKSLYDAVFNHPLSPDHSGVGSTGGKRVMYRSNDPNDNTFHDLKQRQYQKVNFDKVEFSARRRSKDDYFGNGNAAGLITASFGLTLGIATFIMVVRKSQSESPHIREKRALEMHRLVTGRSNYQMEKMNLDRPTERPSERLRELKI